MRWLPFAVALMAFAQAARAAHVTVEAVADHAAVAPGGRATVALVFTIEPGWHLYWINPGEAGSPPKIKWDLPAGVRVSAPDFPTPGRIVLGDVTSFGYEHAVALLQTVTVPADAKGPIELKAAVQWVVCGADACVREAKPVSLTIGVGDDRPAAAGPFAVWQGEQPARPEPPRTVVAKFSADGTHGSFDVPLSPGTAGVDLFPPKANFLIYDRPAVADGVMRVNFRVLPGGPTEMTGRGIAVTRDDKTKKSASEEMSFAYRLAAPSTKE